MTLKEYKNKRSFTKTPEPEGGKPLGKALQFVVQKHAASHLHYDFRLELNGVLKSWAIPKGPSLNPSDKRLAMQVEDHPFDYKDFEGIIPSGNYGAGTVIVWDEGTYEPLEPGDGASKADQERALAKAFKTGSIKIRMHGKKLKGEFALVQTKGRGDNSWLLIKHRDKYTSEEPVTEKDRSVVSSKTLEQVAANPRAKEWHSRPAGKGARAVSSGKDEQQPAASTTGKKAGSGGRGSNAAKSKLPAGNLAPRKSPMPHDLEPMLATLVDEPFDKEGWLYEIKFDGYRALSYLNKGNAEIRSRNNKSFNEKFYPVYEVLRKWNIRAVLDGEIVVMNEKGLSGFGALQNWRSEADGELAYYIFDIIWYEGADLSGSALQERRELLHSLKLPAGKIIRFSENFDASGTEFFATAKKMGLEGIIAKKSDSPYIPGARSREWLKIKTANRQEVIIGGYTKNDGSSKLFSSLLVGVFQKGKLQYTGKIGTGFTEKMQREMMKQFQPLVEKKSPFAAEPDVNKPSRFRPDPPHANAVWLKPKLICEVSFREMTEDGVMRHPSFEGMREDKKPADVVRERAVPTPKIVKGARADKTAGKGQAAGKTKVAEKSIVTLKDKMTEKSMQKEKGTGKARKHKEKPSRGPGQKFNLGGPETPY